jgi:3-methyladenine DNA glycosylase AlkD
MKQFIKKLKSEMRSTGDREKAKKDKAYHKSPFKFYGVNRPFLGGLANSFYKEFKEADLDELLAAVSELWQGDYHEEKSLAIRILQKFATRLDPGHLDLLESMLHQCTGWEHTDDLSVHVVGNILLNHPHADSYAKVKSWSWDEHLWVARASVIAHILPLRKERADFKYFFETCNKLLAEKDFFIRKAIGWALREGSHNYPIEIYDFLKSNFERASNLTFKEGSRKLPEDLKSDLLALQAV